MPGTALDIIQVNSNKTNDQMGCGFFYSYFKDGETEACKVRLPNIKHQGHNYFFKLSRLFAFINKLVKMSSPIAHAVIQVHCIVLYRLTATNVSFVSKFFSDELSFPCFGILLGITSKQ